MNVFNYSMEKYFKRAFSYCSRILIDSLHGDSSVISSGGPNAFSRLNSFMTYGY